MIVKASKRGRPRLYDRATKNVVSVRLTEDIDARLREYAERHGLSVSKFMRYCIEKVLDEEEWLREEA